MTDAPERIWVEDERPLGGGVYVWNTRNNPSDESKQYAVEYIRADLVGATEAENQRLREALDPDNLAQIIRAVDGGNRLGAGALAEKISAALRSTREGE